MSPAALLAALLGGQQLDADTASAALGELLDGHWSAAQAGAFLAALALRGESADELAGFARALRQRAAALPSGAARDAVDTCGTGGSGLPTTNTSTAAAFVLAAAGVPVAKHGNRASSGRCGSADVLEELGAAIDLPPAAGARLLDELGLAFLFAPRFHPALRALAPLRRELGVRTVFNLLGPLCNPAGVRRQVLGVSDARRAAAVAGALARLGTSHALVVAGADGLDELSLGSPSLLLEVRGEQVVASTLHPADVGLAPAHLDELSGGDRARNAHLLRQVLDGRDRGPRADHVALNAAAGLVVAGRAADLRQGLDQARDLLSGGAPGELLRRYVHASQRLRAEVAA